MKKREYRGFTIVELVIVIAVIAVLATVLVPTFGDLIGRAQAAAATQQVANAYIEALVKALANDGIITEEEKVTVGQFIFTFKEGGQGAQILTEDFPYPQVCIVDGKVQLGPKQENEGDTEASEEPNPPNMPEPTITSETTIKVESITLEKPEPPLNVGEERRLSYTIAPAEAAETEQIVWASSDTSVAIVENGTVTAVGMGKATITASVDGQTASCEVDVTLAKAGNAVEFENALKQGGGVLLQEGFTYSKEIRISENSTFVMDLNECKLTMKGLVVVEKNAELTIVNGIISTSSHIQVEAGGKLKIVNCSIDGTKYDITIITQGTTVIVDSTIGNSGGVNTIQLGSSTVSASLTMVNTSVTSESSAIEVYGQSVVDIFGGNIIGTYSDYAINVLNGQGTVNFHKDGENLVTITAENAYSDQNCLHGSAIVNGSKVAFP